MLKKRLGIEAIESDWYSDYNLTDFYKTPPTLTIPEGCERIGNFAFWRCERLKKVEIPKSVEKIREHAFCGCINATIILRKRKKDFKFGIGSEAFCNVKDVKEEIRG